MEGHPLLPIERMELNLSKVNSSSKLPFLFTSDNLVHVLNVGDRQEGVLLICIYFLWYLSPRSGTLLGITYLVHPCALDKSFLTTYGYYLFKQSRQFLIRIAM
jgi:hypothetical protein